MGDVVVANIGTELVVVVVVSIVFFFLSVELSCEGNTTRGSFSLLLLRWATLGCFGTLDATISCYYVRN